MKDLVWNLFKETGDIKYFLLYKKITEESDIDDNRKSRRDSSK